MKILAIESSCDETAAAVVEDGRKVLSSVINSQVAEPPKIRRRGAVDCLPAAIPKTSCLLCRAALDEAGLTLAGIDAVAVTAAPGLIGALFARFEMFKLADRWGIDPTAAAADPALEESAPAGCFAGFL